MDAKEVAERITRRLMDDWHGAAMESIIAEEIEKAMKPEKVKTRGEVVAEELFSVCEGLAPERHLEVTTKDGKVCVGGQAPRDKLVSKDLQIVRRAVAKAIDAERASAAKEERDRAVKIIRDVMEGGHPHNAYKSLEIVAAMIEEMA